MGPRVVVIKVGPSIDERILSSSGTSAGTWGRTTASSPAPGEAFMVEELGADGRDMYVVGPLETLIA